MARFDREADLLPASLESAGQELRALIERQVREIVDAAEARASAIEEEALRNAREIERESERAAETLMSSALDRASLMLEAIDSAEKGFAKTIASLRADVEALLAELGGIRPASLGRDNGTRDDHATEEGDEPMAQELIREQLLNMYYEGTPRADVERFISRFERGSGYLHLLDEIYGLRTEGLSPPQNGGLLQRLRRRAGPSGY